MAGDVAHYSMLGQISSNRPADGEFGEKRQSRKKRRRTNNGRFVYIQSMVSRERDAAIATLLTLARHYYPSHVFPEVLLDIWAKVGGKTARGHPCGGWSITLGASVRHYGISARATIQATLRNAYRGDLCSHQTPARPPVQYPLAGGAAGPRAGRSGRLDMSHPEWCAVFGYVMVVRPRQAPARVNLGRNLRMHASCRNTCLSQVQGQGPGLSRPGGPYIAESRSSSDPRLSFPPVRAAVFRHMTWTGCASTFVSYQQPRAPGPRLRPHSRAARAHYASDSSCALSPRTLALDLGCYGYIKLEGDLTPHMHTRSHNKLARLCPKSQHGGATVSATFRATIVDLWYKRERLLRSKPQYKSGSQNGEAKEPPRAEETVRDADFFAKHDRCTCAAVLSSETLLLVSKNLRTVSRRFRRNPCSAMRRQCPTKWWGEKASPRGDRPDKVCCSSGGPHVNTVSIGDTPSCPLPYHLTNCRGALSTHSPHNPTHTPALQLTLAVPDKQRNSTHVQVVSSEAAGCPAFDET
ncbi:hypothetical protein Bbelb_385750 [Branchiostoma belcheri]|nr:hypothetical protein Bbelb_385750 [Branchiostoma belcheri]